MTVIIIGGTKGGTGKTTMVVNQAVEAVNNNKNILLMDCDPQQSASSWGALRDMYIDKGEALKRVPIIQKSGEYVNKEILTMKDKFDHIIIDAGGHDNKELRSALLVADKIYVPLPTSQFDIWGTSNLFSLIEQVKSFNKSLIAKAFLSQAEPNPNVTLDEQTKEAMDTIDSTILSLSETIIHKRVCFKHSIPLGRGITELERKDSKGIKEIKDLYSEIFGENGDIDDRKK